MVCVAPVLKTIAVASLVAAVIMSSNIAGADASILMALTQASRAPQIKNVNCAHGGVGIWPIDQPRPYYAVVVVDIDLSSAATSMISISEFNLFAEDGSKEGSLVAIEGIEKLPMESPPPPWDPIWGAGTLLTEPLSAGTTRVRIRVRVDKEFFAENYKMTLTGLGEPRTITGTRCYSWPT